MKKIFLLLCALAAFTPVFSQISAGTQGLTVKQGTILFSQGLILTPSTDLQLTSTNLTASDTAIVLANGSSIKKVYSFSPAVTFSGVVGIKYLSSDLNGNPEDSLAISFFNGAVLNTKPSHDSTTGNYFVYSNPVTNVSMGVVTANRPIPGVIVKSTGSVSAMNTTYGTASTAQTFSVSGTDIITGITVAAPAGYEVSLDGTTYNATVTINGNGTVASTTVYVRIKSTSDVGTPAGYVALTSPNSVMTPMDSVLVPAGTITPKSISVTNLTITSRPYNGLLTATAAGTPTLNGLVNSDAVTVDTTTAAFSFLTKNAGNGKAVTVSGYALLGAKKTNYTLTQPTGITGNITRQPASLTVSPLTKCYAEALAATEDSTHFTTTGFVSGEGISAATFSSPGLAANTASGNYTVTASNAVGNANTDTANYSITYNSGQLTILDAINATITTAANVQLCAGNTGSISINASAGAPFTGRFRILNQTTGTVDTVSFQINNSGQSAPSIPANYLTNNTISPINYKITWVSLQETGNGCYAASNQLTGQVIITVFPVPNINAVASASSLCNGSGVNIALSNPNGVGGTYNVTAQYNGVMGGNIPPTGIPNNSYSTQLNETLSLNNSVTEPVNVLYVFTPVTAITSYACVGTNDTVTVTVNPKPQFAFAVNSGTMTVGGTDTICQAAPTTLAITNATNGYTFTVKHTWVDGNGTTQTNNNYGSGTIVNGGFTNSFISGGNSVSPSVNPSSEPTAGTYEITLSNPAFVGCTTTHSYSIYVQPKPEFSVAVNGNVMAIGGTDTICQAAPTTFAITNATNGQTFAIKHTWVDGNSVTQTNNDYGSGTVANGGFSTSFISGGNSVSPSVDPNNEPTAGAYQITMTNPTTGCTTTRTFNIYVQPKPEFSVAVNGNVMAIGGTDTICQAAPTTFAITNATNGQTFVIKHTWVDGNSVTQTNNNYGSGTVANGGFSASFTSGGNSVSPSVNPSSEPTAGTYQVTMTNPTTGCTTVRSFNIYVQPKPEFDFTVNGNVVAIGGTDTICQAAPTTIALANATNGQTFTVKHTWVDGNGTTQSNNDYGSGTVTNGGFSNSFISGGNSVNPSVNPANEPTAGAYQITMTNPTTGCTTTRTFNIYVQPKPEFSVAVNGNVMSIGGTDTICQAAPTTFAITNATNGQTFVIKHTWVDGNSVTQTNNNYGSGTVANGGFSASFTSGGNSVSPSVNPSSEPTAGTYQVTMTNPTTGCTTVRSFNIYVQPKPEFDFTVNGNVVAIGGTDTICQAAPTTIALANATNGQTFTVKHTWVDGNSVTQTNNNYGSGTVTNGGFSNSFTSGGNSVSPSVNPANEPTAGAYQITMTNPTTGCTTTRTFNIYVNPKPVDLFSVDGTVQADSAVLTRCAGIPVQLSFSGVSTHSFAISKLVNPAPVFIVGGQVNDAAISFTPTAADSGSYSILLTDNNTGCTAKREYSLRINQSPSFVVAPGNLTRGNDAGSCSAVVFYNATAVGSGNTQYTHTFSGATTTNGFEFGKGNGSTFNKGVTTVTIRASNGLCADKDTTFTVTVNDTENPTISYTGGNITSVQANHVGCSYHVATTDPVINDNCGTGGLTLSYQLTGATVASGNGNIGTFDFNVGLTTVTYTVVDQANNQSTTSYTVNVASSAPSVAQVGLSVDASCYGSNTGAFTFQYNNSVSGITTVQIKNVNTGNVIYTASNPISVFTGTQSNLVAGTYRLYVTNVYGCTDSTTVVIAQPVAPLSYGSGLTSTNVACGTPGSGSITFGAGGGTAPYQVAITGPNLGSTPNTNFTAGVSFNGYQLTGLGAGVYTVSITDGHNCNIAQSVTITAPSPAVTASVGSPGVPFCLNDAAPSVTFKASGGTHPYTFSYTVNGTPQTVTTTGTLDSVAVAQSTTAAGTFTYNLTTVTDANGTPCATNIAQGQGGTNVVVNDCSGPDLVPVVLMPATSFSSSSSSRTVILNVSNVGTGATHGMISISILKPTQAFTYSAPNLPANWTVVDDGSTLTFETTNIIGAGNTVQLSGTLSQTPGANAAGVYTMTTFVNNGAGGETNTANNVKFTTVSVTP